MTKGDKNPCYHEEINTFLRKWQPKENQIQNQSCLISRLGKARITMVYNFFFFWFTIYCGLPHNKCILNCLKLETTKRTLSVLDRTSCIFSINRHVKWISFFSFFFF